MKGEVFLIVKKILEREDNPVKETIGNKTPEKIVQVVLDEYWKEWRRKIDYSPSNNIVLENLGSFYTTLSGLKGYTRLLIKKIRTIRKKLKELEQNPDFDRENSKVVYIERDLTRKLQSCWVQLEERRKLMIMRYLRYANNLKEKNEAHRIKYNYEWFGFKFLDEYGYNSAKFKKYEIKQENN